MQHKGVDHQDDVGLHDCDVTVRHFEDSNVLDDSLKIRAQLSKFLTFYNWRVVFGTPRHHITLLFLNEIVTVLADDMW
jgi:hypothetical protein